MPSKTTTGIVTPKESATPIRRATEQLRNLFEESSQALYLFQDDHNKSCNKRFAQLLGYATPEAWAAVHTSFPAAFVAPDSQEALISTYQSAMNKGVAASLPITWKRKDGKTVDTDVILVPIEVDGERLALHFISA
ncbi:MAG: PAS domain-containing protein [Candidatus Thermoplasmatota archaeon]|jgi:PAS domain S-box-containing protein